MKIAMLLFFYLWNTPATIACDCMSGCESTKQENDQSNLITQRLSEMTLKIDEIERQRERFEIDLDPGMVCPDPDISEFIKNRGQEMTVETLKENNPGGISPC